MRVVFYCALLFILIGCAGVNHPDSSITGNGEALSSQDKNLNLTSNKLTPGSQIKIIDPNYSEVLRVLVGKSYLSALGQQCYHIEVQEHPTLNVLCSVSSGQWRVVPSVHSYQRVKVNNVN